MKPRKASLLPAARGENLYILLLSMAPFPAFTARTNAASAARATHQGAPAIKGRRASKSNASFKNWLNVYHYDQTPLDAQIVEVKETDEWRREKITFNGAENERAIAYL